ncbi:MAG TPA: hypothetical protein DEA62_00815 [Coxiellaceae bacterium]|nr:hypothetical protein [Coxiellaceae bacterium]
MSIALYCLCFWPTLAFGEIRDLVVNLTSGSRHAFDRQEYPGIKGRKYRLVTTRVMLDEQPVQWAKTEWELVSKAAALSDGYELVEHYNTSTDFAFVLKHSEPDKQSESCIFDPDSLKVHVSCYGDTAHKFISYIVHSESPIVECESGQSMMVSVIVSPKQCGHKYTYRATVEDVPAEESK